jgi:hypothetical protein
VVVGFRTAYGFDVDQTDGAPLPQAAEVAGDPGEHTAALKRAIAAHGISIEYADDLGGALGLSCGGRIRVLNGLSAGSEFSVLAHEFAHLCSLVGYVRSGRRLSMPVGLSRARHTRDGGDGVQEVAIDGVVIDVGSPVATSPTPNRFLFSEDMKAEGFTRVIWEIEKVAGALWGG